jgi:hypothetical protein
MVLEGLVQRKWPFLSANKDKLQSFQERFYCDPFTGTGGTRLVAADCGTKLVMTTGRLNA